MADAGLLIGWNRVVPGRDIQAVQLWGEMQQYFRRLHAEGMITRFEPVMLGAYGGDLNGFVLIRGTQENLDTIRNSEQFLVFNVRANKLLDKFMVVRAHFDSEVDMILRLYATA